MQWLNKLVDDIEAARPDGDILIESGGSPSGTYHLGHLRELITADAILLELDRRGRSARHIYYVDDLDALRKIPVNVPADFEKYLGKPLGDIPAPDGSDKSYAGYFVNDLVEAARVLAIEIEFVYTHDKYPAGFFVPAIELALESVDKIRSVLENISGHRLDETWSPIQINEDGYLKKRKFVSLDKQSKQIKYLDKDGNAQTTGYSRGEVKLDWRIDWPARWWLMHVDVEPFGRDHATKGGSYDTGAALMKDVFQAQPPLPVPYDFVNLVGDTKKMSASKGTGLDAITAVRVLPPEIVRFFMLRYPPSKRIYFDPEHGVSQLIDEYAEAMADEPNRQLIEICRRGLDPIVSKVPFSHLVASYQSALKDKDKTLKIIARTGYPVEQNRQILSEELDYIDQWLNNWAPDDIKFELLDKPDPSRFTESEKTFLSRLADEIEKAPDDADGEWFHKAIYQFKESDGLSSSELFTPLYRALIGQDKGPRAGWFLSILPRDWLIKRLRLES